MLAMVQRLMMKEKLSIKDLNVKNVLTRSDRVRRVLILSQVIQNRRLSTRPWTHEEDQWLREDLGIAKVTVAEVAILVHCLERLDCVVEDAFQLLQYDVAGSLQCVFCRDSNDINQQTDEANL